MSDSSSSGEDLDDLLAGHCLDRCPNAVLAPSVNFQGRQLIWGSVGAKSSKELRFPLGLAASYGGAWLPSDPKEMIFSMFHAGETFSSPRRLAQERRVTFVPGPIGIKADWSSGRVVLVVGAQGLEAGVQPGWVFHLVDGTPYTERLLDEKIAGQSPYEVTFDVKEASNAKGSATRASSAPVRTRRQTAELSQLRQDEVHNVSWSFCGDADLLCNGGEFVEDASARIIGSMDNKRSPTLRSECRTSEAVHHGVARRRFAL